jgi:hypothetical protein
MQLIRHLNDEELTDFLLQSDERELQPVLNGLPVWLRSATDLPDRYWRGQRAAVRRRIATKPRAQWRPTLGWAMVMTLIVVALVLLRTTPAPKQVEVVQDPDQQLLVAVEQAVHRDVPSALEPASLLAEEISSGTPQQAMGHTHKEKN